MVTRIYAHGIHDFCNEGHDRQFMKAKHAFPNVHLMVGIINDKLTKDNNIKTIFTQDERWESVFHCRHVDEVISDAPWIITDDFIKKHKIDFVAHTDSYNFHLPKDAYDKFKESHTFLDFQKDSHNLAIPPDDHNNHGLAAFSDDPEAIDRLNKCVYDFNNRTTLEQAKKQDASMRPIRVYADGIYDMFHPGHARQLKQAKEAFPKVYLMVGVVNDELTNKLKGPTHVPEQWRYDKVRHCKYVDEVVRDAPWVLTEDFLSEHKIDFVAHDDIPYKYDAQEDVYYHVKQHGMFLITKRMEGVSTTSLKLRLKF